MELKEGYKQTEVGVIPNDWNMKKIPEIVIKNNGIKIGPFGSQLKKELLVGVGYKVYGQENVFDRDMEIGERFLTKEHYQKLKSCELLPGDFIISMMGTIGKCMLVPRTIEPGIMDSHLLRLRLKKDAIDSVFLLHFFSTEILLNQVSRLSVGGIMDGLSSTIIKKISIPIPPTKAEQTAIATALSDADALIQSLEKLIAKKRNIKQGAMQELLKPKEGWVVKKLGEICDFQNGTSLERLFNKKEGYSVISIGNYSSSGNYVETNTFIDNVHSDEIAKFLLKKNELTLLMNDKTSIGTIIGRVLLIEQDDKYVFNQRTMRLKPKNNYNSLFLYHLINSGFIHKKIVLLAKPGTQIYINTNDIIDLELFIPKSEEQASIATILSDMDAEIAALETKFAKYKQIKQGMMQNLLTGKIRLV